MPQKVCPRCGAMYDQLKSTTCPSCFAKLVVVDDQTAEELVRARAEVEATPEFQVAKTDDDERFQEQTFGGVLGVGCIALLTLAAVIAIIIVGVRRYNAPRPAPSAALVRPTPALDIAAPLPIAGASPAVVLPPTVGPYRRAQSDQFITLPGTLTPIFHAVYRRDRPDDSRLDVYAIPTGRPTAEQNEFRLGIALAAQAQNRMPLVFATDHWRFAVVGPGGMNGPVSGEDFRRELAKQLREK